ncbi:hypothetical protein, partial [Sphingobacterium multivorum]|uniref:hypothetical protein n=1 Tax=Sphingobacterium multivorum TaxID=28454 RepID=UPI003DA4621B
ERLPWSKGYNILPVQSDEIVCLKMITPQTFGMIQRKSLQQQNLVWTKQKKIPKKSWGSFL